MRILSWNVNGIRAMEKKGFFEWLQKESPDILCLQETKAHPEQLTEKILAPDGYLSYWASAEKKGYSGVSIYTKRKPKTVSEVLGFREFAEGLNIVDAFVSFMAGAPFALASGVMLAKTK